MTDQHVLLDPIEDSEHQKIAGVLLDRLLDFDDALDTGGEWDEGGGVSSRWW